MEQGLNDGGYLVCKFAFRVSREIFSFLRRLTCFSEFQDSLPWK